MIPTTVIRSLPAVVYHPVAEKGRVITAAMDLSSAIVEPVDAVFADTNNPGVPGPGIRAHQVAEFLFGD